MLENINSFIIIHVFIEKEIMLPNFILLKKLARILFEFSLTYKI